MISGTLLKNGTEQEVTCLHECGRLGIRTNERAKTNCTKTASYAPVYRCPIFRFCSPFAKVTDSDLIQPCEGCPKYTRLQSGFAPAAPVTIKDQ